MSPDETTSAAQAPIAPAESKPDPFRRVVEVASGPNESGIDELVKQAHTLPPEPDAAPGPDAAGQPVATESAIAAAMSEVSRDVETSTAPRED